jgi:hypothetical protein
MAVTARPNPHLEGVLKAPPRLRTFSALDWCRVAAPSLSSKARREVIGPAPRTARSATKDLLPCMLRVCGDGADCIRKIRIFVHVPMRLINCAGASAFSSEPCGGSEVGVAVIFGIYALATLSRFPRSLYCPANR